MRVNNYLTFMKRLSTRPQMNVNVSARYVLDVSV